jgi:hypothetical protein
VGLGVGVGVAVGTGDAGSGVGRGVGVTSGGKVQPTSRPARKSTASERPGTVTPSP